MRNSRYRVVAMEETYRPLEVKRRDPNLVRLTQVGLLLASLGAVLVIFNPFSLGVVGLVLAALGTVLAARGGLGRPGSGWLPAPRSWRSCHG